MSIMHNTYNKILLSTFVLAIFLFKDTACLILSEATFRSDEDWEFMRRFCFVNGASINITIEFPTDYENQMLLFYHDGYTSWNDAYKTQKTCREKVDVLDSRTSKVQQLNIRHPKCTLRSPTVRYRQGRRGSIIVDQTVYCKFDFEFVVTRPTWWFIAMANCDNSDKGLYATYDMTMTNGNSLVDRHFSCDEIYILPAVYVIFFVYLLLVAVVAYFLHALHVKHKIVHIYAILLASVLFSGLYLFIAGVYWTAYGNFGVPNKVARSVSYGFSIIGQSLFIAILLFLSVGYCVIFTTLSKAYILVITIVSSCYMILQLVVYIFQEGTFDPGLVVYRSETPFGIVLEILRLVILIVFLITSSLSAKKFEKRRKFFIIYAIVFGLWFISMPIMVLLSSLVIVDYVREKVVVIFDIAIMALGHIFLIALTRPTVGNTLVTFMKSGTVGVTLEEAEMRAEKGDEPDPEEGDYPISRNMFSVPNFEIDSHNESETKFTKKDLVFNNPSHDMFNTEVPPPPIYTPSATNVTSMSMLREHMDTLFTTSTDQQPHEEHRQNGDTYEAPVPSVMNEKAIDSAFVFPSVIE